MRRESSTALLRELIDPLMLAAYAAWAAVWYTTVPGLAARAPDALPLARSALLVFLAAFVAGALCDDLRRGPLWFAGACTLMVASAFTVIALGPSGSSPILLVMLAAMLAARLPLVPLVLLLAALNLGLLAIMRLHWEAGWNYAFTAAAAYGSFQAFAALVMRATARAEAMAADLRTVNAELLATRSLLEEGARDSERLRLSRELHDVAGHKLTALKLNLGAMQRDAALAGEVRLGTAAQLVDELLGDIRGVVRQLRAHAGVDLSAAIAQLAAPLPRPRVHVDVDPDARPDSMAAAEALLRTAQEALTNAARHADARNVWIRVQRAGERIELEVRDDGRGAASLRPGNGLAGMRERLDAVDGVLELHAQPGAGVRVCASVPAGRG